MRRVVLALIVAGAVVGVACYGPNVVDGAFACSADQNFVCPSGLICDPSSMLCVPG